MVKNLIAKEILQFIIADFKGTWDSVAMNDNQNIGRGNFMFGRQAMTLLEFISRLCSTDLSGKSLSNFSLELYMIEQKYSLSMPGKCVKLKDFNLPYIFKSKSDPLIWCLFDLIRHGLAHQYQQIIANLKNNKRFAIKLTGADFKRNLKYVKCSRPFEHLSYSIDQEDDLIMTVCPEVLFLDLENAINKSNILNNNTKFEFLKRPYKKKMQYYILIVSN
jgi:hypothetical protein